jgi:hypothetical protein
MSKRGGDSPSSYLSCISDHKSTGTTPHETPPLRPLQPLHTKLRPQGVFSSFSFTSTVHVILNNDCHLTSTSSSCRHSLILLRYLPTRPSCKRHRLQLSTSLQRPTSQLVSPMSPRSTDARAQLPAATMASFKVDSALAMVLSVGLASFRDA